MKRLKSKDSRSVKAWWTQDQKLKFVRIFCTYGNMAIASVESGVPIDTCNAWRNQQWFKDALLVIQGEVSDQRDANINRIVEKSLMAVEDRLDHGDAQFNQASGEIVRIPVKAQVVMKITSDLLNRQDRVISEPMKKELEKTIDDRLAMLSQEFARFASMKTIDVEVVDAPSSQEV
jgi:hypothetical protein